MFIRFLSRRGKYARNRKIIEFLSLFYKKSLISGILHENHENARNFMKFHGNRGWSPPKSLKTLRNYNGFGKGWRRGWKWWYFGETN